MNLNPLFNPGSVLLIGSSKITTSRNMISPDIFNMIRRNLLSFRGEKHFADIEETGKFPEADLTIITLPPEKVLEVLGKLKTRFVVILPGGFDGKQREKIKEIAEKNGFRILGPNSVCGIVNPEIGLNTTFEQDLEFRKGGISVISQSGGVGATLLDLAVYYKFGISKFVWVGDMLDINEIDLLEYMISDSKTEVIMIYLEGLKNPRKFIEVCKSTKKPVLVMKGGVSEQSKKRALSHTDSMSTESEIYSAAFKQSGVVECHSLGAMFNQAIVLDQYKGMSGNRIAVVSNTGGSAILAADWCHRFGLELSEFSKETKEMITRKYSKLDPINPLDIIADADGERYKEVIEIILKDKNVDGILIINQLKSCMLKPEETEVLKRIKTGKPMINCAPGAEDFSKVKFFLRDTMPVFSSVKNAVKAFRNLHEYSKIRG